MDTDEWLSLPKSERARIRREEDNNWLAIGQISGELERQDSERNAKRLAPKDGQLTKIGSDGKTLLLFHWYSGTGCREYVWAYDSDDALSLLDEHGWPIDHTPFATCEQPKHKPMSWSRN